MGLLVGTITVVVRRSSINERYRGGWNAFLAAVPNRTFCFDGHLASVSFMTPADAEVYVRLLEVRKRKIGKLASDLELDPHVVGPVALDSREASHRRCRRPPIRRAAWV